jgi:hypothetical protein
LVSHTKGRTQAVVENKALRRIFGPKGEDGEKCIMRRFIICTLCKVLHSSHQRMGHDMYWRDEKYIQNCNLKT